MAEDATNVGPTPGYELIGAGVISDASDGNDGGPLPSGIAAAAFRQAMTDCVRSMRSVRFWLAAVSVLLVCWGAGVLIVIVTVTGGGYPPEVRGWGYILTRHSFLWRPRCWQSTRGWPAKARDPTGTRAG